MFGDIAMVCELKTEDDKPFNSLFLGIHKVTDEGEYEGRFYVAAEEKLLGPGHDWRTAYLHPDGTWHQSLRAGGVICGYFDTRDQAQAILDTFGRPDVYPNEN
jgi:hypothetical protein